MGRGLRWGLRGLRWSRWSWGSWGWRPARRTGRWCRYGHRAKHRSSAGFSHHCRLRYHAAAEGQGLPGFHGCAPNGAFGMGLLILLLLVCKGVMIQDLLLPLLNLLLLGLLLNFLACVRWPARSLNLTQGGLGSLHHAVSHVPISSLGADSSNMRLNRFGNVWELSRAQSLHIA